MIENRNLLITVSLFLDFRFQNFSDGFQVAGVYKIWQQVVTPRTRHYQARFQLASYMIFLIIKGDSVFMEDPVVNPQYEYLAKTSFY